MTILETYALTRTFGALMAARARAQRAPIGPQTSRPVRRAAHGASVWAQPAPRSSFSSAYSSSLLQIHSDRTPNQTVRVPPDRKASGAPTFSQSHTYPP